MDLKNKDVKRNYSDDINFPDKFAEPVETQPINQPRVRVSSRQPSWLKTNLISLLAWIFFGSLMFNGISMATFIKAAEKVKSYISSQDTDKFTDDSFASEVLAEHEATTWATSENLATLPSLNPERFQIENWPSGHLKSKEPIAEGKINGIGEYWFDNGQLYGKIPYLNGQKHGAFTLYIEDGSVDQELRYKNGQLHGINRWYNPPVTWLYINNVPVRKIQ